MREALRFVILLMSIAQYGYGMSGDRAAGFDSGIGFSFSELVISLPRLETQGEERVELVTPSAQLEHEVSRQSPLERLPLTLAQKIMQWFSIQSRRDFALISKRCRAQAQWGITHLSIPVEDITDVKCNFLNVKSLTIKGEGITPWHIDWIAQNFPSIESLNLAGTDLSVMGIEALCQPSRFKNLKMLNLSWNEKIGNAGIMALSRASFASQLETLSLRETNITGVGVQALSQPDIFTSLKALLLGYNANIGDEDIATLAKAPFAATLESLELEATGLTGAGIRTLSQVDTFIALKSLGLGGISEIGDLGVLALAHAPFAHNLESLSLWGANLTVEGIRTLSQQNIFKALKILDLGGNNIGDAGARILTQAPFAGQLESFIRYNEHRCASVNSTRLV